MSSYRKYLGANIGNDATLHSNRFEICRSKIGEMLLLLKDYEVRKISHNNLNSPKPKHSSHMWIKVPDYLEKTCIDLYDSSRKICVKGKISEYRYKNSNKKNVSLDLYELFQVKPKRKKLIEV